MPLPQAVPSDGFMGLVLLILLAFAGLVRHILDVARYD